ncbi:MAG: efflux RND transporter periplasmic adaptor subunit [Verrucomicrobiales bacterium]
MTTSPDPPASLHPPPRPARDRRFGWIVRLWPAAAILGAGWLAFTLLARQKPKHPVPAAPPQAIRTRVMELETADYRVSVKTHGVVRAYDEITVTAEVAGRIVKVHPGFEDGAFFSEDEVLVELEPDDYATAVLAAEAQLARAAAAHAQEQTRAKQARLNWRDLGYNEEPNELVLRLPQLREAQAAVDSAKALLERARRDLERTKIRAPFAGRVRARTAGPGQSLAAGTPLGTVFATEAAYVRLPIAAKQRRFLTLPESTDDPSVEVTLHDSEGDAYGSWTARIIRCEGALDENSLDLYAIARVDDPFALQAGTAGRVPLRLGQPVTAHIPGHVLSDVTAIPRDAVRQLDRVYLVDSKSLTLKLVTITPLWSDEEHIIVRGLPPGMLLAMTPLVYAPDGAKVTIIQELPPADPSSPTAPGNEKPESTR